MEFAGWVQLGGRLDAGTHCSALTSHPCISSCGSVQLGQIRWVPFILLYRDVLEISRSGQISCMPHLSDQGDQHICHKLGIRSLILRLGYKAFQLEFPGKV